MHIKKRFCSSKYKSNLIATLFFCSLININAQDNTYYSTIGWEDSVEYEKYDVKSKLITDIKELSEFHFEDKELVEYYCKYQREYLPDDKDIEENNRRSITYADHSEVMLAKARVIRPNGSVVQLEESDLLEAVNEESGEKSKYFAFEGLEKQSIIEYMFVMKMEPSYSGRVRFMQQNDSVLNYTFELASPKNLIFKFKTYNDTNQVRTDTNYKEKNLWRIHVRNIPGLHHEPFAPMRLLYKKIAYKLDQNLAYSMKDITSYGNASKAVYTNVHGGFSKADKKAIDKFIKAMEIPGSAPEDEVIWKVENYLKTKIRISENVPVSPLASDIYQNKVASKFGILRVFSAVFAKLGINYNIVLTCERDVWEFDKDFETYNSITDYLIYFPGTNKFLSPSIYHYRYGLIPYELTNNHGLFIKETASGDIKPDAGSVQYIPLISMDETYNILNIAISLSENFDEVNLDMVDSSNGYYSVFKQPFLNLVDDKSLKELMEGELENQMSTISDIEWELINTEPEVLGKKPLVLKTKATNNDLVEKAGKNFLFKIGELIGPQMELYSEDERSLPLYSNFKRYYKRTIALNIPKNYRIKNLVDLRISKQTLEGGSPVVKFESDYSLQGNSLKVSIVEFYDKISFEVDEYEIYREVVNCASDFNKVVLVLEPMQE